MKKVKVILQLWCDMCKRNRRMPAHRMPDEFEAPTENEAQRQATQAGWRVTEEQVQCPDCVRRIADG